MAWKTKFVFGSGNLTGNAERLEALAQARSYLKALGVDSATINESISHERDHLFAFQDFDESSGKKLKMVLQEDPNEGIRLAVIPNRLQIRDEVRKSVGAVFNSSLKASNFFLSILKRRLMRKVLS